MTDKEAFKLIGQRAEELTAKKEIQEKMVALAQEHGKEYAEQWLYRVAIATLCGM